MILWVLSAITLAAVLMASFVGDIRRAILALWVAGLGVGAIYLTVGAELLAVIQWIVSTIVAISFIFFAVMFGEFGSEGAPEASERLSAKILHFVMPVLLGVAFAAVIWLGANQLPEVVIEGPVQGNDLAAIGRSLTGENLLALEVLALTLFLVLVGGGVIARPEGEDR